MNRAQSIVPLPRPLLSLVFGSFSLHALVNFSLHEFHELRYDVFQILRVTTLWPFFFLNLALKLTLLQFPQKDVNLRRQRQMANEKIILSKSMARSRSRRHL